QILEHSSNFEIEDIATFHPLSHEFGKIYKVDDMAREAILRKLLLGKGGILTSKESGIKFINEFFKKYIDSSDPSIDSIIKTVLEGCIEHGDTDLMYYAISGILKDNILQIPQEEVEWSNVIDQEYSCEDDGDGFDEEYDNRELAKRLCYGNTEDYILKDVEIIEQKLSSGYNKNSDIQYKNLNSTELLLKIVTQLGSIGIRFVQVIGQYIDIPEELLYAFDDIYDNIKGQTKITAHSTVLKENKELEQYITKFGKTIGGGSMATVYEGENNQGEQVAIRVQNPSLNFQLIETYKMLQNVFEALGKDNSDYKIASHTLSDIYEWINVDMNYPDLEKKDKRYSKKWDGYSIKGNDYSIRIPKVYQIPSNKVKIEEYVDGDNLTSLKILEEQGHDAKAIVKLIINHYIAQIKDGQVHADVHLGNYRLSKNNQLYVLDRTMFIDLTLGDKLFIKSLTKTTGISDMIDNILKYLSKDSKNSNINIAELKESISQELQGYDSEEIGKSISKVMILLRKSGCTIPLKITLLIKNINAMIDMSKSVGLEFKDIFK
ncbi:MAG: AarF/ABC1/UbiB kinase family protein, partial [Candidatus Gracilibacteria bacterium]|nr:AarF/ABC1/UbiB kinase family protein [Candidatus Gracilibacteria bacterium]